MELNLAELGLEEVDVEPKQNQPVQDIDLQALGLEEVEATGATSEVATSTVPTQTTQSSGILGEVPTTTFGETSQVDQNMVQKQALMAEKAKLREIARNMPVGTDAERTARDAEFSRIAKIGKEIGTGPTDKAVDQKAGDLAAGVFSMFKGAEQMAYDIALKIPGIEGTELGVNLEELSEENQAKILKLNEKIQDKDFFSTGTLGKVIPTLVTLPVAYSTKTAAFLIEGALAYSETRGSGVDEIGSLVAGLAVGAGSAAVMKVFEALGPNSSRALREIQREFTVSDKEAEKIYTSFAKYIDKDVSALTDADKTMAILAQGEEAGAAYFDIAAKSDAKAKKALDALSKSKDDAVTKAGGALRSKGQVARAIKPLEEQQAFASNMYNEMKALVMDNGPKDIPINKQPIIDELGNLPELQRKPIVNQVIKKLGTDEEVSLEDLFDIREAMSGVNLKMKRVDKAGKASIDGQQYVDSIINANLPEEFAPLWDGLKKELSLAYSTKGGNVNKARNNTFGELLSQATKGNRTYESILEGLAKASGGKNEFKQMMQAIGSEPMREFEQGLIKEVYQAKGKNLGKTIERLKHLGFTTPEGRNLKQELKRLDEAFSSDDFYDVVADIMSSGNIDGTSITANILSKIKYAAMSEIWSQAKIFSPFGATGKAKRHVRRVTKAIKSSSPLIKGIQELNPGMYKDFEPIIRESIEKTLRQELDNLGMQFREPERPQLPGSKGIETGDVNLQPKYGTEAGTIADNPSTAILAEREQELVNKAIKSAKGIDLPIEDTISYVNDKYVPMSRVQNMAKNIQAKANLDDLRANQKMIENIINDESKLIIDRMERDLGVKLPKSEANKLVMNRFKEVFGKRKGPVATSVVSALAAIEMSNQEGYTQ